MSAGRNTVGPYFECPQCVDQSKEDLRAEIDRLQAELDRSRMSSVAAEPEAKACATCLGKGVIVDDDVQDPRARDFHQCPTCSEPEAKPERVSLACYHGVEPKDFPCAKCLASERP